LPRDEFVALVGPSRSGKSLVIELAAGLVRPEAGRVVLLGHEWNDTSESEQTPVRLRVGTVLQQPGLLSNMTLFHNVLLPLRYHHGAMPERSREQAVMAQLERLGLSRRCGTGFLPSSIREKYVGRPLRGL
jgi:ABC-type transporter Mla maintaining outer membrane lipid asymmetry ATPase subunit MlaF